jgi:hypothetical protein
MSTITRPSRRDGNAILTVTPLLASNSKRGNEQLAAEHVHSYLGERPHIGIICRQSYNNARAWRCTWLPITCGSWRLAGLGAVDELLGSVTHSCTSTLNMTRFTR